MLKLIPPGQRKDNPFFVVRGTVNGRRIEVSAQTRDRRTAETFKAKLEAELIADDGTADVAFGDAARFYMSWRKPGSSDRRYIENLITVLGDRPVRSIRQHDLVTTADLLHPNAVNATKNRQVLGPAAAILHYGAKNEWCNWQRIEKLKEPRPTPRHVSRDAAALLLANSTDAKRLLLTFLFRQGLRISDTLRIGWSDIDRRTWTLRYRESKNDDWREIPLHRDVIVLLKAKGDKVGWVFPWRTRSGVYKWLRPLCVKLGVKFTPHRARHSFATWLIEEGAELLDIMEAGGWKDIKSVARYGRPSQDRLRSVINRIGEKSGG